MLKLVCAFLAIIVPAFSASVARIPEGCKVSDYGRTGDKLPLLVKDAIKSVHQLPLVVAGDTSQATPDNVIVIDKMSRFFQCWGIGDADLQERLRDRAAFSMKSRGVIFFNGERPAVKEAAENYARLELRDRTAFLPYRFASYLAHELQHLAGESNEGGPLAVEYATLVYFREQGKIPSFLNDEIAYIGRLADEYRRKEYQASQTALAVKH